MQLPIGLIFSVLSAANGFLSLTSPTRFASIPAAAFHPYSHILGVGSSSPNGYLPAQIRTAYGLTNSSPQGEGKSIAIVGAYAVPHLSSDVAAFNSKTGTIPMYGTEGRASCTVKAGPHPCLEIHSSSKNELAGWETEASLDTEWAHAIAPKSDILVVQATDASARSFAAALTLTDSLQPTVASMSWGGAEFAKEGDWNNTFSKTRFVAASGDRGSQVNFPSSSANVLAVGGTTLKIDQAGHRLTTEQAWQGSGGGISIYEPRPSYQSGSWLSIAGKKRLVPDVAYNADPTTGYAVYSLGKWIKVGGTSAGAPQWAALLTLGKAAASNTQLYHLATGSFANIAFTDVRSGNNGKCALFCTAHTGYDEVTGFGTPLASGLVSHI